MNKAILKGNCGQDPRITTFEDGGKVAQFTLATTERGFKTREGREVPDYTDWHNIVVKRSGLAGIVEQYVKKGTQILVEGKIQTRKYQDEQGQTRYVTEIVVEDLDLCGGKREGGAPGFAPAPSPTATQAAQDNDNLPWENGGAM